MKSKLENFYLRSPVCCQNILTSIYGLKIHKTRHKGVYKTVYNDAVARLGMDKKELEIYTLTTLKKVLEYSEKNVPYYQELYSKNNISSKDILELKDIARFPLLEKEIVRKAPEKLISKEFDKKDLLCIHTTGTTGTPLKIYCNAEVRQRNYAYYNRFLAQNKIEYEKRRATFGGRIIVPIEQDKPPFWRYSVFQRNLLFSSYHLSEDNLKFYIDKLIDFKPDYIDAYPSSLFRIAEFAQKHGIDMKNVAGGITTSAESLGYDQRNMIEETFGIPVVDQYGAAEMSVFVGQCNSGNYHLHSDYGMLEFLKDDGTTAMPGEEAELVCTGFINNVMPLIRYRIGDRGILSDRQCDCGSSFPLIERILGRCDDVIITPDGGKVGRLSPVLKGFPIREAQYIQNEDGSVDVLIVKTDGFSKNTENDILMELEKRLGKGMTIRVKPVEMIQRGAGGKLRNIISRYKQ